MQRFAGILTGLCLHVNGITRTILEYLSMSDLPNLFPFWGSS